MARLIDSFQSPTVLEVVQQTDAIRWWIDKQIEDGKSDEEIRALLPVALAVISGKVSIEEVKLRMMEAANGA